MRISHTYRHLHKLLILCLDYSRYLGRAWSLAKPRKAFVTSQALSVSLSLSYPPETNYCTFSPSTCSTVPYMHHTVWSGCSVCRRPGTPQPTISRLFSAKVNWTSLPVTDEHVTWAFRQSDLQHTRALTHPPGSSTPPAPLLPARPSPISSLVLGLFFQGGDQGANSKPSCLVNVLDHSRPRSEIKALCYSILSDEVFSSFSSVIVIVTTAAARGFIRTIMRKAFVFQALHNDSLEFDFSRTRLTSQ